MKIHLVNSAVMPSLEGVYCVHQTTETQFAKLLIGAFKDGNLRSYIGYEQTAQHIEKITGVKIEVRREQCVVDDNDMLAIIRLNHRPAVEDKVSPLTRTSLNMRWRIITLTRIRWNSSRIVTRSAI